MIDQESVVQNVQCNAQRIVINTCFGGFGISHEGYLKLIEWGIPVRDHKDSDSGGEVIYRFANGDYYADWLCSSRKNPLLLRLVEEMGPRADGEHAQLRIAEVPLGVEWEIDNYDGKECVAEKHRIWR